MKSSKFNVLVTPEESPGFTILYNTFHDHRLVIQNAPDKPLAELFRKIESGEDLDDGERETAATFLDMGILLPDHVDERKVFDDWYANKIQNVDGRLALIVVTTMACNLRCPYCYEKDQLDNSRHMDEATADRLIDWVKSQVVIRATKELEVIFFGGEPLMNKKILYRLSDAFKAFSETYGCRYEAAMISNGVLMTPDVAKRLRKAGLKWVKITVDGDKHVHDTTRVTAKGQGSFDRIWSNLEAMNADLEPGEEPLMVSLGGNFKDDTYDGFLPLLDRLVTATFRPYIKQINIKPILNVSSNENGAESGNPCDKVCFNETNTGRMIAVREELAKRGLPAIDGLNLGPCDFYRGDSFTVGLSGGIYPCIAFVDNEKASIGNVNDDAPKPSHVKTHRKWEQAKPWTEDCYDCSFLPVCTGGCRATAYSNGYSWNSTVCEKDYFVRMSKALAKELLGGEAKEDSQGLTLLNFNPASLTAGAQVLAAREEWGSFVPSPLAPSFSSREFTV
jgi:uncharacterized protein